MDQDVAKHFVGPDFYICYSKTCVKRPFSKRPKNGFQDRLSLNAGQNMDVILPGLETPIDLPIIVIRSLPR